MEARFLERCRNEAGFTLSWAQSLNGALSARPGSPTTLSGPASMAFVHRLRSAHQAILVGIGTVLADDPRLNVRLADGPSPRPVVVDPRGELPDGARLWHSTPWPPLVLVGANCPPAARERLVARGADVLPLESPGRFDWQTVRELLASRGLERIMVEGGYRIHESLLASPLPLRLAITLCPRIMGGPALANNTALDRALQVLGSQSYDHDFVWFLEASASP